MNTTNKTITTQSPQPQAVSVLNSITRFAELILDAFFPKVCILCNSVGSDLCTHCSSRLPWPKPRPRRLQWMTALWNYRDPRVKMIVVTLKNKPHKRLAYLCGIQFATQVSNTPTSPHLWVLIPIPSDRNRKRSRGYNQSAIIAHSYQRALRTIHGIALPLYTNVLIKTKSTHKQGTTDSREERIENMKRVFHVVKSTIITGKCVILIDDVTTTGATLIDARRALIEAGAHKVLAWTIAN